MQTLVIPATEHQTAGEFVHDQHLTVLHDIVHIAGHNAARLDRLVDVVQQGDVVRIHQVFDMEERLSFFHTVLRQGGGARLFVHNVVALDDIHLLLGVHFFDLVGFQRFGKRVRLLIQVGGFVALTRNDQGGTRLIDQDGVHLVHHGEVVTALHLILFIYHHVIPQIIEPQLVVGAVGDVRVVGGAALVARLVVGDQADGQPQIAIHLAHPFAVAAGQIVVDGNDMYTLAAQRVQIRRQSGDQRFTFTGFHLGDAPLVQNDTADDLHREMAHTQHPPRCLAADRERIRQNIVGGFAVFQPVAQHIGLMHQLVLVHGFVGFLQRQNFITQRLNTLYFAFAVIAEQLFNQSHSNTSVWLVWARAPHLYTRHRLYIQMYIHTRISS